VAKLEAAVQDAMQKRAERLLSRLELERACARRDVLAAALVYAGLNWPVFPLYEVDENGRCACSVTTCKNPGKHPRTAHGVKDATIEPTKIRQWWRQWPRANIGFATGSSSALLVIDQDGPQGALTLKARALPRTPTVRTGRLGGRHLYFRLSGQQVPNRVKFAPGLDLRAEGGYVIAPPSRHVSGAVYEWITFPDTPLAAAPAWLLEYPEEAHADHGPALNYLEQVRRGVDKGYRHYTALRIAGSLLARNIPPDIVKVVLRHYASNCRPPHDPEDCDRIVADIAAKEAAKAPDSIRPPKGGVRDESNFRPESASELLASRPEPERWVWDRLLPQGGVTVLAAYMKTGKTTLAYPLALAVAKGQPFLNHPTQQGAVLILAVEEHPRMILRRLRRFGLDHDDPVYVHRGRLEYSPAAIREIQAFILANHITLLVVDTLARFWNISDENNNAEVIRRVNPILDLARDTDCAILLIHHERKSGGEEGRSIRGGSALLGLVDQALILDRRQGGAKNQRLLTTLGRYDESPPELVIELIGNAYRLLGTPEQVGKEAAQEKVLAALTQTPQDINGLVALTKLPKRAVREVLDALDTAVVRTGRGRKRSPYLYQLANSVRSRPNP